MKQYRVLLIEADQEVNKEISSFIEKEGFTVIYAETGKIGFELLNQEIPDIIITDLKMPDMISLEILKKTRQISINIPVIFITSYSDSDVALAALQEGAFDYIKKPIDPDILRTALGRAKESISILSNPYLYPFILLTEDEEMTRKRLARVMEKEGWKVYQACNGEDALSQFNENKIDIVLLDIKMPVLNGLQTLKEMRKISNDFEAVILSGYGDEESAIQAMRNGAMSFLSKPIDLEKMLLTVEKASEKLATTRALKYKKRELELAKEIIAKITSEKEIIIDFSNQKNKIARNFAQTLIDSIPSSIVVYDKNLKIHYINKDLSWLIEYKPESIDDKFIKKLAKIGIKDITFNTFLQITEKLYSSPVGTIENISMSKYAYISFIHLSVINVNNKESLIAAIMRGERI